MPYHLIYEFSGRHRKRTKAGKELDEKYRRHEIGYTYYNKIKDKRIYWEWA